MDAKLDEKNNSENFGSNLCADGPSLARPDAHVVVAGITSERTVVRVGGPKAGQGRRSACLRVDELWAAAGWGMYLVSVGAGFLRSPSGGGGGPVGTHTPRVGVGVGGEWAWVRGAPPHHVVGLGKV